MDKATLRRHDSRFWQVLPLALLGWVLALWGVGRFLSAPAPAPTTPETVEERLVELPEPVQAAAPHQEAPPPKAPPPLPTPALAQPVAAPPPPPQAVSKTEPPAPPSPPPPPPTVAAAPTPVAGVESHGPIATSRPDPVLPDDLLDQVSGNTITVHVVVAVDGSFTVDVPNKAVDPRVRRALIEQIKQGWHFSPAVQAGRAVPMAQDLSFSF